MRAKLTAKHPRPATPERAPVRRGSTTARKPVRPATVAQAPAAGPTGAKRAADAVRRDAAGPAATRGPKPAGTRAPRDAAAKPVWARRDGDAEAGSRPRREGGKPAFGRGPAGGDRKAASSAAGTSTRTGRPARSDADAGERRRAGPGQRDERAPRFGGSRERDERPARRSEGERGRGFGGDRPARDGERPARGGSFRDGDRPARGGPLRDGERPARGSLRDGDRPARPRRDADAPEKRGYGDRRPIRAADDARPAPRRERDRDGAPEGRRTRDDAERRPFSERTAPRDDRRVARPVKAGYGDRPAAAAPRGRAARDDGPSTAPRPSRAPAAGNRDREPRARTDGQPPRSAAPARAVGTAAAAAHTDESGSLRLSKRMSELGLCSRREADEWIEKGWVYVDGERIDTLGTKITPDQKIEIDPAALAAQARQVTILLHKPVGYVSGQAEDGYPPAVTLLTGDNHWDGDRSGLRFSAQHLRTLAPAGRLDIDSTGMLVLTQDGRVAKQLIGEQSDIDKEYLVRVTYGDIEADIDQHFPPESLAKLRHGLSLDDVPLKPAMVSWQNGEQLRFVLREGKKRQIRRMCELVGLKVVGLKRVRMGRVLLGALPQGQWRYLMPDETF